MRILTFLSGRSGRAFALAIIAMATATIYHGRNSTNSANAQDATASPVRTAEAVSALQQAKWRNITPGLEVLNVLTALGTELTALRIVDRYFSYSLKQQDEETGIRSDDVMGDADIVLAINAGFFAGDFTRKLTPVGLLIDDGKAYSRAWPKSGGYLALPEKEGPFIQPSPNGPPDHVSEIVQSKPVILEPGGKWAMNTNTNILKRRTIYCRLDEQTSMILVVSGAGLSLYETGWLLRSKAWGGFFDCQSAIGLDGGKSTQLSVAEAPELNVYGATRVQNLLVVKRRNQAHQPAQAGMAVQ